MDTTKTSNITSLTTITFKADDNKHCFETNRAKNVVVTGSWLGTHDHGSSKIKLTNVVDYNWKEKNYSGRLIAIHLNGHHVAYAIKVNNKEGVAEGMIRVINSASNHRNLIKGMSNEVLDLQFAHMKSIVLLGSIEQTALYVHKIDDTPEKVLCTLMVKIEDPIAGHVPLYDKIKWCPFVPEGEDDVDEYVGQQIVWFRGCVYQCYSIKSVIDAYGIGQQLSKNVIEGSLKQKESAVITGATFSPDGSTLSVSCQNGVIRFYQIYFHTNEQNPRCLHKWIPHSGKSISNVFFLDDHTTANPDKSLWKYAITTCDNNTELKVWCCSTWECLQTVNFKSPVPDRELFFQADIDHKSSYLVMSDIKSRSMFVLQIEKPTVQSLNTTVTSNNTSEMSVELDKKDNQRIAFIKSISEFPLSSAILSFGIVDAEVRRYKPNYNDNYLLDDMEEYDEETNSLYCVVIRMYLVQPKSVQECRVLYQPTVSVHTDVASTLSGSYKDTSVELPIETNVLEKINNGSTKPAVTDNAVKVVNLTSPKSNKSDTIPQTNSISLMTPDSFNSPGKLTPEGVSLEVLSTIRMLAKVQSPPDAKKKAETLNILNLVNNKALEEHELKVSKSVELNKPAIAATSNSPIISGGSSPSREVQEILSVKEDSENLLNEEFYEDNNDLLDENDADSVEKLDDNEPYFNEMNDLASDSADVQSQSHAMIIESNLTTASLNVLPIPRSENDCTILINEMFDHLYDWMKNQDFLTEELKNFKGFTISPQSVRNTPGSLLYNIKCPFKPCGETYLVSYKVLRVRYKKVKQTTTNDRTPCWSYGKIKQHFQQSHSICRQTSKTTNCFGQCDNDSDHTNDKHISSDSKERTSHPYKDSDKDDGQKKTPPVNNKTDWPKIPKIPQVPVMSNIPNTNTFNNVNSNTPLNDMAYKLDQVLEFMQTQACQISELRNAIEMKNGADDNKLKTISKNIEFSLTKTLEDYLIRHEREHKKKMEAFIAERDKQSRDLRDAISHSVAQFVTTQISERLTNIMMNEIPRNILPVIHNHLEKMKVQILTDVGQKLRSCDQVIKESILNMASSKASMETFGSAVVLGVQAGLQKTYTDSLKTTIIPSYERSTEELFRQIQTIFLQGTKSYTKQFDAYMSQYQPLHDETSSMLAAVPEQLKSAGEATISTCTSRIQNDITKDLKALQVNLVKTVRDSVKKEIQKGFENHANSINESTVHSQAPTPAPTLYDVQEQIKQHLAQGQINTAFHHALVANDLNLVEFTLEKADYKQVFNPCPLQQPVLLSLIQQIAADMNNHNDLKQRYLSDAIVSLDIHDATTREHAPKITRELYQHCQNFISANPHSPLVGGVKMLMMAVQGIKSA